ncbi:MAG: aminotransferase class IV [Flavobacteriales bacterium]|nr:aminotransferase class IV [Flavobacteriales bacterium]
MKDLVNINGEVVHGDKPVITLDNRAFHYGDGSFESMRVVNGKPRFLDPHWARLTSGAELLRIELPKNWIAPVSERYIVELVQRTGHVNARCPFTSSAMAAGITDRRAIRGGSPLS